MKVKFFVAKDLLSGFVRSGGNARKWEDEVNTWLADNPQARITFVEQTATGGSFLASQWFISLWYEDGPA
ncbi:MAG: hypothetical protein ACXVQY_02390 [Actinomycetota bacterium]